MTGGSVRSVAMEAKAAVVAGRAEIRKSHDEGESGKQVAAALTQLVERTVLELLDAALIQASPPSDPSGNLPFALVALGGFGRGDLSPFSDLDLLILVEAGSEETHRPLIRRFTQDLYDSGLQPAVSVRDVRDACQSALRDATIFTALVEARRIAGSPALFERFQARFRRLVQRRAHALVESALLARREERRKYGETVYLLSPNVKRSRGGLRDLQLIRWIGYARYGSVEFEQLRRLGALGEADLRTLIQAKEFLVRVRHELHFQAGKAQDQLTRDEQVRIATRFGFAGRPGVLPVESFMTDYIGWTSQVRYVTADFAETARARFGLRQIVGPVFSFNVGGDFRVGAVHVTATRQGLRKLQTDLVEVLRLMDLANVYDRRIDHATWTAVREAMSHMQTISLTTDVAQRFLAILSETNRLGDMLRRMHELRVLEKIVPAFRRARCLLQFNEYHKYTVDEHCIRAVEAAAALGSSQGLSADVYRSLKRPQLLHLALLLHDVGKGETRDHSEVGEEIAEQTCIRLGLSAEATNQVRFLVRQHLRMANLAMYRDLNDDTVVAGFAAEVQSVETLKMLYVLSYADLSAVGPEVLNPWKLDLLTELYLRTVNQLTGRTNRDPQVNEKFRVRLAIADELSDLDENDWRRRALDRIPNSFLEQLDGPALRERLEAWNQVTSESPDVRARFLEKADAIEVVVAAVDRPQSGFFHRITGALTSRRFEILTVDAVDLPDGRIANRYLTRDLEATGPPTDERLQSLCRGVIQVLVDPSEVAPAFRSFWRVQRASLDTRQHRLPTRVQIDNDTAEGVTIVDVFAHDRTGLLYAVSRKIFELGLEVRFAKIGTYLDQVVDVFYVTDHRGQKVVDPERLREIVDSLLATIEALDAP